MPAVAEPADGAKEHDKWLDKNILNALILSWGRGSVFSLVLLSILPSAMVPHLSNPAPSPARSSGMTCSNFLLNDRFTPKRTQVDFTFFV